MEPNNNSPQTPPMGGGNYNYPPQAQPTGGNYNYPPQAQPTGGNYNYPPQPQPMGGNGYYPPMPPPKKSKAGLIIGIVAAVLVVLAIIGFIANRIKNADNREYVAGTVTKEGYENEFFDIRYNLPEGWEMMSDDELSEASAQDGVTYEMGAINRDTGCSTAICKEVLESSSGTMDSVLNETLKAETKNSPLTPFRRIGDETIAGKEFEAIEINDTTLTINGVSQNKYFFKDGKYVLCIVVTTSYLSESFDDVLDCYEEY